MSGCTGSEQAEPSAGDESGSAVDVPDDEVDVIVDAASASVSTWSSVHVVTSLTASIDDERALIVRADTSVDVTNDAATSVVLEPVEFGSDEFVVTEEWAYHDGSGWRRPPSGEWTPSDDGIAETALALDVHDERLGDAVAAFVAEASQPWTAAQADDGSTTYTSDFPAGGESRDLMIDRDGQLISLSLTELPAGASIDDPRRYTTTVEFDGIDTTTVDLPTDLPTS